MAQGTKKSVRKLPKPKLSKEELAKRRRERARERSFLRSHRVIFERIGFSRITPVDGVHFEFEGLKSELDDIFVFENVVVLAEYTRSSGAGLAKHAKGKGGVHSKIAENPVKFLEFFRKKSTGLDEWFRDVNYTPKQLEVRIIYASIDSLEDHHKALFKSSKFMSLAERSYFNNLTRVVKISARQEVLEFLGVDPNNVGQDGVISTTTPEDDYQALLLPREQSHFPDGFRIVSFYIDPDALLRRAYVLRRNGWRDSLNLYQRLIIPSKIKAIRAHLREKERVFANNIVITLPADAKIEDVSGHVLSDEDISKPTPATLKLKKRGNSVGIIDGQHRVFSYYADITPDKKIDKYRLQQNLLATGIIYPSGMKDQERERFEAGLFLEINSTQASAASDIIQAIWVLLDPFKPISVSRVVVNRLAVTQPLAGRLARSSLDSGRIKTASIVAYGLQPLTKRSGNDSLFSIWDQNDAKARFADGTATNDDLDAYIDFCVSTISGFLAECRTALDSGKWKLVGDDGGILSVTVVNGLIILLRKLIADGKFSGVPSNLNLGGINSVDFKSYKSSQYADLATILRSKVK
ncbi:hypothetical protein AAG612_07130 [Citromicrobium bathyomarinum]|uniref:hypothetical protein n=1 Tax=Citromicrobium bathyomarinum TaxID=72174 RepID=UPI00315A7901